MKPWKHDAAETLSLGVILFSRTIDDTVPFPALIPYTLAAEPTELTFYQLHGCQQCGTWQAFAAKIF